LMKIIKRNKMSLQKIISEYLKLHGELSNQDKQLQILEGTHRSMVSGIANDTISIEETERLYGYYKPIIEFSDTMAKKKQRFEELAQLIKPYLQASEKTLYYPGAGFNEASRHISLDAKGEIKVL